MLSCRTAAITVEDDELPEEAYSSMTQGPDWQIIA